jgi:hypothetical protein
MRHKILAGLATLAVLLTCSPGGRAERISEQEALTIARNYVRFILLNEGGWGRSRHAEVSSIEPFMRGDRQLGYFCRVQPRGFLVISLHKELAPVRAYSGGSNLDPEAEEGLTDLLKDKMEAILAAVDERLGRPLGPDDQITDLLELDYRAVSDVLVSGAFDPEAYREPPRAHRGAGMNYQERDTLLVCNWHQKPPFNQQCPDMGCSWPAYGNFNQNALVGCVATAGAQIMHHWHWPLTGEDPFNDTYDWANMLPVYIYHAGWFTDSTGVPVTWAQINAVAELCNEVGISADMEYGCEASSASVLDLAGAYHEYFHYGDCGVEYRVLYLSAVDWFDAIKNEINYNRPIPYAIQEHAIVADGWKEELFGGDYYWYHMNYGWVGTDDDTWYALDELPLGNYYFEYMITGVRPASALGLHLEMTYSAAARYFDLDASGTYATFLPGNGLQILKSGFLIRNTGSSASGIEFQGLPEAKTRFYLEGDLAGKTRISIQGGAMKICGGGEMAIY